MSILKEFDGFDGNTPPPQVKFICSNIKRPEDIKELEALKAIKGQALDIIGLWRAEENADAEERRLWIKGIIKSILVERGNPPSYELLDAATHFALLNCIIPSCNPKRNGWFIEMLCCFCDDKEFSIKEYLKNERQ